MATCYTNINKNDLYIDVWFYCLFSEKRHSNIKYYSSMQKQQIINS